MNQKHTPCEAHWEPDSTLLKKGFETHIKLKSRAKASRLFYATRPQELRFRGTPPCHSALQGRVRSAVRCTASELSQENRSLAETAASPKPHQVTAPALPGAGASGETPPSARTSEGGTHSRGQNAITAPRPCRGFGRVQTHLPRAPKHPTHASL